MTKTFLLLYGWQGNADNHWQTLLAEYLKEKGAQVLYPQLPNPDDPKLADWLAMLEKELESASSGDLTVVTHSLSGALWLQYLAKHPDFLYEKVIFVAPTLDAGDISEIKDFFPLPSIKLDDRSIIIGSDNDPYIPKEKFETLAENLGIKFKLIPHIGHINVDSGYGRWEWMEEECLRDDVK